MKTILLTCLALFTSGAHADDNRIFGRCEDCSVKSAELDANLGTGLTLMFDSSAGRRSLIGIGGGIGLVRKTVTYVNGSKRTDYISNIALLTGQLQLSLADQSIQAIDLVLFRMSSVKRKEAPNVAIKGGEIRFNKGASIEMEIRFQDTEFTWDVLGKSVDGRALRAGFGVGMYLFSGPTSTGESDEKWIHGSVVRGTLAGIYTFSDALIAQGSIEVFPLAQGGETISYTGTILQAQGTIEYAIAKHFSAYVQARYDGGWVKTSDLSTYEDPAQNVLFTGGVVSRW